MRVFRSFGKLFVLILCIFVSLRGILVVGNDFSLWVLSKHFLVDKEVRKGSSIDEHEASDEHEEVDWVHNRDVGTVVRVVVHVHVEDELGEKSTVG